ncbi:MAG: chemotaxis response regulator protein-glutamate methylesterase [Bdellovibrionales bacterium RIFOXYD1_FULL_53_11]|nr:MAG: chemotaxis response regulator protein-glutamate methylesterase [Bdellovibrionales bacterium RIFOXYD1_FULL_53_11]
MGRKLKVLIIDDSALVREILSQGLSRDADIEVVGTASDPYVAAEKITKFKPDVLTLDVEMPRMDGVEFLKKLMPQRPLPVVMVSALTERGKQITLEALAAGAVDFVTKPKADVARGLQAMLLELAIKVKIASTANVSFWKHKRPASGPRPLDEKSTRALAESTDKVVAIGASAGGTEAIAEVIAGFPAAMPGVVIVQHMPPGFTQKFSERLNTLTEMEVKEAADGDRVMQGRILVAPGGMQLEVARFGGIYKVQCRAGEPVCGHMPSVEVMMQSVARHAGKNAVGVMLTGMGHDGGDGLKAMRDAGARTIAQDEATCVVFGMPKVAWEKGGVERLVPLDKIAPAVLRILSGGEP